MMILSVGRCINESRRFKRPVFSRMDIHAYVRRRKFIHIGSIMSIMHMRRNRGPSRERTYERG